MTFAKIIGFFVFTSLAIGLSPWFWIGAGIVLLKEPKTPPPSDDETNK